MLEDRRTGRSAQTEGQRADDGAVTIKARIDEDIKLLTEELEDLPRRVEYMFEGDSFPFEWEGATLGLLSRLHDHYEASEMTAAGEHDYLHLRSAFAEQVPLMERAGLATPRIPLVD